MKKLSEIRIWLFGASIVVSICYAIITLIDVQNHIDLELESFCCFIFGVVLLVLAFTYPLIHKAELMIAKMEDEEDKKDK
ncbi:MAG: hypothetical protein K2I14_04910 [Eubacterium sp.]|nr:hypothetical protein [Eubacterium sp.]